MAVVLPCMPPMSPKSMPYWNGLIETSTQAKRHFQFARIVSCFEPAMTASETVPVAASATDQCEKLRVVELTITRSFEYGEVAKEDAAIHRP